MKSRTLVVALLALAIAGPVFAAGSSQAVAVREGVTEISKEEVTSLVTATVGDMRYVALQQVAQGRRLRLDPNQAKGLTFPEGYRVIFVPVFDERNVDSGFLASSEDSWTLALDVASEKGRLVEGFAARLVGNKAVVEAHLKPPQTVPDEHSAQPPIVPMGTYSTSCQYVSGYSMSIGCWSFPDNPFGYYYTWVYRYGHTTDPYSQWWACWQGSVHVCPQIEEAGSPITWPVCGYPPPAHPRG